MTRVGIVGLGDATSRMHLPALRRLGGTTLVGGSDIDPGRRAAWERRTDTPAHEGVGELLAEGRPDVVIVATPPWDHCSAAVAALEAGAHVLCEKPLAAELREADRMLEAAAAARRRVGVNHHMRETPIFKVLAERIAAAEDGELVFCQIAQVMDFPPDEDERPWRDRIRNRVLLEGGVHLVDLMIFLQGGPPDTVSAQRYGGPGGGGSDAIHLLTLGYADGRLGQLTMNRLSRAGTRYVEVRADCERASLRASMGGRAALRIGKERAHRAGLRIDFARGGVAWLERGLRRRTLARNPRPAGLRASATLLARSLECFEADREPPASGREARAGLAVIEAAYRSGSTGEVVRPASEPTGSARGADAG